MNSKKAIQIKVVFKKSAYEEFRELDGGVKKKVLAQLIKVRDNPLSGEPLGNKRGHDLTGYRKIYVDNRRVRIVWRFDLDRIVVVVMGIGPRDKGEVYMHILDRLAESEAGSNI